MADVGLFRHLKENRRLTEHEDRLDRLERAFKVLEGQWDDTYDRMRHMMGRIVKRAAVIEKHEAQEAEQTAEREPLPDPTDGATEPAGQFEGRYLTARQRQLQQQILGRRSARRFST